MNLEKGDNDMIGKSDMQITEPEKIPRPDIDIKEIVPNETVTNPRAGDNFVNKSRLELILQLYVLEFPDTLTKYKDVNFSRKTIEELREIKDRMDAIIGSKTSLRQTQQLIRSGIQMLEFAAVYATPIKCAGLTNSMMKDPEVIDDIKHIALKRMSMVSVDPEMRLAYKLVSNMMILHNSAEPIKQVKKEALDKVNSKYTDI